MEKDLLSGKSKIYFHQAGGLFPVYTHWKYKKQEFSFVFWEHTKETLVWNGLNT